MIYLTHIVPHEKINFSSIFSIIIVKDQSMSCLFTSKDLLKTEKKKKDINSSNA